MEGELATEDAYDTHICLNCRTTVVGLINYVKHKKEGCPARVNAHTSPPTSKTANQEGQETLSVSVPSGDDGGFGTVQLSPNPTSGVNPNMVLKTGTEKAPESFLSCLELQSRTSGQSKNSPQKSEDYQLRSSEDKNLPISNLLNDIGFSSDDEEALDTFGDYAMEDDSDDDYCPPRGHTGGKWKPGSRPPLGHRGGKWKPGARPPARENGGKWQASQSGGKFKESPPQNGGKWSEDAHASGGKHSGGKWGSQSPIGGGKNMPNHSENESESKREPGMNGEHSITEEQPVDGERPKCTFYCQSCNRTLKSRLSYEMHLSSKYHMKRSVLGQGDAATATELQGQLDVQFLEQLLDDSVDTVTMGQGAAAESHPCTVCDKEFGSKYLMARHLLTTYHHRRAIGHPDQMTLLEKYHREVLKQSPFHCQICSFYCNTGDDLMIHLKTVQHSLKCNALIGPMFCALCSFSTYENEQFLEHMSSAEHVEKVSSSTRPCVVQERKTDLTCKFCGKMLHSSVAMKRHLDFWHGDGQPKRSACGRLRPICKFCGWQSWSKSTLKIHVRRMHTKERPFRCELCNKSFTDQASLKQHDKGKKHFMRLKMSQEDKDGIGCMFTDKKIGIEGQKVVRVKSEIEDDSPVELVMPPADYLSRPPILDSDDFNKRTSGDDSENVAPVDEKDIDAIMKESQKIQQSGESGNGSIKITIVRNVKLSSGSNDLWSTELSTQVPLADEEGVSSERKCIDQSEQREKCSDADADRDPPQSVDLESSVSGLIEGSPTSQHSTPPKKKKRKYNRSLLFKCDFCNFKTNQYLDLRPHYIEAHNGVVKFCMDCGKSYKDEITYAKHLECALHKTQAAKQRDKSVKFTCKVCEQEFYDQKQCYLHEVNHFITENELRLKGKNKKYQTYLDSIEHLPRSDRVECPECGKQLKKTGIENHLRLHTSMLFFQCHLCSKKYSTGSNLRQHMRRHIKLFSVHCDVCGKGFYTRDEKWETHMKRHRKGPRDHVCEICGKNFISKGSLTNHLRLHTEKKFKCPMEGCRQAYVHRHALIMHMRVHTEERPYLCDECGYAGKSKNQLTRHKRTHTGEKKYSCEYCPYRSVNSSQLRRHMRIHIGTKPYQCPYCDYSCNTMENIRKHITKTKKHAGRFVYSCQFCKNFGTNESKEFTDHLIVEHNADAKDMDVMSAFAGIYKKTEDIRKPEEGAQILPTRERGMSKKKDADSDDMRSLYAADG